MLCVCQPFTAVFGIGSCTNCRCPARSGGSEQQQECLQVGSQLLVSRCQLSIISDLLVQQAEHLQGGSACVMALHIRDWH